MIKYKWSTDQLYSSLDSKQIEKDQLEFKSVVERFVKKWSKTDKYLKDPKELKKSLDDYNNILENYNYGGQPGTYFFLISSLHEDSDEIRAKYYKYIEFLQDIANSKLFFTNKLSKVSKKYQELCLSSEELFEYRSWLERLFKKGSHVLSEEEEKVINLMSKPAYSNWVDMTSSLMSKESAKVVMTDKKKAEKNFSELMSLMDSNVKAVRDSAAYEFNKINNKFVDTATFELNSILELKKVEDQLRGYKRADESSLEGDDVTVEFVDELIKDISLNNSIPKSFYELKAKILKVKKLEYHERNLEVGKVEKTFTANEAIELVRKVFSSMSDDFVNILDRMLEEGKIDFYPSKGKTSGAFCMPTYKNGPVYVLLNHTNRLQDVLTFAHEMGHAIHYHYAKKQKGVYFGTSMATAEVASTFMEDFVLEEILKTADDELKLSIMMLKLNEDVSTIFRQIACYRFELDLHNRYREKGFLSKEDIGNLFQNNMKEYMGNSIHYYKGTENWWVYWSHIRRFFYVYSYASGLLISKAMQQNFKENREYINDVIKMFSQGEFKTPVEIFKEINIDLLDRTFWNKGIARISSLLKETETLAKKLGKI